jgi:hypothetical protein
MYAGEEIIRMQCMKPFTQSILNSFASDELVMRGDGIIPKYIIQIDQNSIMSMKPEYFK